MYRVCINIELLYVVCVYPSIFDFLRFILLWTFPLDLRHHAGGVYRTEVTYAIGGNTKGTQDVLSPSLPLRPRSLCTLHRTKGFKKDKAKSPRFSEFFKYAMPAPARGHARSRTTAGGTSTCSRGWGKCGCEGDSPGGRHLGVYVFIANCSTYYKAVRVGGGG